MDWLFRSREEISLAWLLLTAVVGGVVGSAIRYFFDDVLRVRSSARRDTRLVVRKYAAPLVRSSESLERRIDIIVRMWDKNWLDTSEYFRLSTLYVFAVHVGYIEIIERAFGFLPFDSVKVGRAFNRRLYGIYRSLSSFYYFPHRSAEVDALSTSEVPRFMFKAIGESILKPDSDEIIGFAAFLKHYANEPQYRNYFRDLEAFLSGVNPQEKPIEWDRLLAAEVNLWALVRSLDKRGELVEYRPVPNLNLVRDFAVEQQLIAEIQGL